MKELKSVGRAYWPGVVSLVWIISICAVCYFSLMPRLEFPLDFWNADKLYHFAAYGWLAVLPMVGFRNRKAAMPASLSMMILGILLEIGQYYIPGRAFSYIDMSANGLGVLVGVALGNSARPRLKNLLLPPEGG